MKIITPTINAVSRTRAFLEFRLGEYQYLWIPALTFEFFVVFQMHFKKVRIVWFVPNETCSLPVAF